MSIESFDALEDVNLQPLLDRIGDCRLVLIGECTHGTSQFYRMRARITQELIAKKSFNFVAIEADWPDAGRINDYVQSRYQAKKPWKAFVRFPTWMWRNRETSDFIDWLKDFNLHRQSNLRDVGFHGLDIYSLYTSLHHVLEYLQSIDPEAASMARKRYSCLMPWEEDPQAYGYAVMSGNYKQCETGATAILRDLLNRRLEYTSYDAMQYFDATRNAQLVADAEKYYRIMYYGGSASWNLRDQHMFETIKGLLDFYGENSKGVIWAHNSHVGNAAASEMSSQKQVNIGQLCREAFDSSAYLIGQSTDHGTVVAADDWDGPMRIKDIRLSRSDSIEYVFHELTPDQFLLPLRQLSDPSLCSPLNEFKLQRAIGVIYRPDTERQSHYFHSRLANQFDELIWFDETRALETLSDEHFQQHAPEHPFSLID